MAYHWVIASSDVADADLPSADQLFDSQSAAEAWLAVFYQDLSDAGVCAVSLYEENRLIYGPMSLEA